MQIIIFCFFANCLYQLSSVSDAETITVRNEDDFIDSWKFPSNFKFGTATAAYQIEGGWNEDGKGPNIWDTYTHDHSNLIKDKSNGDIAADSYHLYQKDIEILKATGVNYYRFSISWSRIASSGDMSSLNPAGILYYNRLIDALLANGIEPVVTMMHYDLPQGIQDLGGLVNPVFVKYFYDYANVLFHHFGDRVHRWITFNEPFDSCVEGYGTAEAAPMISVSGVAEYLCSYNILKAHASAYHLYKREYFAVQKGKIGITLDSRFFFGTSEAVERAMQYNLGWFANPIFSEYGDFPQIMIDDIAKSSQLQNYTMSRLPKMNAHGKHYILGSADFLGLNYYSSRNAEIVNEMDDESRVTVPSWTKDSRIKTSVDSKWPDSGNGWLYSVPEGLSGILKWIRDNYNNVEVVITENGWSDNGVLDDQNRVTYLRDHLKAVLVAIKDYGCNVVGYTVWSIIDNFEWRSGYSEKFGLYYVDFASPNKTRVPKMSARFFHEVINTKKIPVL